MSGPVDVLESSLAEYAYMSRTGKRQITIRYSAAEHERICAARDAVIELIEAGDVMLRFLDLHQYLDRDGDVMRFRAALARAQERSE